MADEAARGAARRLGLWLAAAVFVVDQAVKAWILYGLRLPERPPIRVGPFFELIMVWNRGISYGLFQQHDDAGRWTLVGVSLLAVAGMAVWLWKTPHRFTAVALGLLIGGALGNAVDRSLYGAVADFVLLHWIPFFPYVFNVADSAIVAGVALLLYESVFIEGRRARSSAAENARPEGRGPA